MTILCSRGVAIVVEAERFVSNAGIFFFTTTRNSRAFRVTVIKFSKLDLTKTPDISLATPDAYKIANGLANWL